MKRNVVILSALLVVAGGVYVGKRVLAQGPAPAPAANQQVRGRIALINLNKVIKEYNWANQQGKSFQEDNKKWTDRINAIGARVTAEKERWGKELVQANKDIIEKSIKQLEREVEDKKMEAEKEMRAKYGNMLVQIYNDIEKVVADMAIRYDFDLVLSYPDAPDDKDLNQPVNVMRKLQAPAAMPMYCKKQAMDLTPHVVKALNDAKPAAPVMSGSAPPPGAGPAGTLPAGTPAVPRPPM